MPEYFLFSVKTKSKKRNIVIQVIEYIDDLDATQLIDNADKNKIGISNPLSWEFPSKFMNFWVKITWRKIYRL